MERDYLCNGSGDCSDEMNRKCKGRDWCNSVGQESPTVSSSGEVTGYVLSPCPFCGHGGKISAFENKGYEATGIHFVFCENKDCGARVFQPDNGLDSAVNAWNRREG